MFPDQCKVVLSAPECIPVQCSPWVVGKGGGRKVGRRREGHISPNMLMNHLNVVMPTSDRQEYIVCTTVQGTGSVRTRSDLQGILFVGSAICVPETTAINVQVSLIKDYQIFFRPNI